MKWKCNVCGYEHDGPEPPETCPVCGVPASEFSPMTSETPEETVPESTEQPTVSDVMVETMINWGVTTVFGMVGHSNLGLADAIRKQCEAGKLKYIGIRHEGAASFAASAFGKLTGKPAACLSIAGPGATNLLTGLWDARMDRIPILALTGQIDTQVLGPGAFQEVDLASAFSSVACWSQTVLDTSHHAELMNLALKNAILQRDVGHLIYPNEVQTLPAPDQEAGTPEGRLPALDITPPESALSQALERLNQAKRPAIIVGHGARFQMDAVKRLANELNCPVITTFKGKGLIRDDDPLGCGVLGRSGTLVSAHFMNSADLLVVFGASFSQHTGINKDIPTIQVDLDPITLGKFHSVDVPVVGEIGITANLLSKGLENPKSIDRREEIAAKKAEWKAEKENRATKDNGKGLNASSVFAQLSELIPDNAVIAVDVGNNTYSFGRYFESKGQPVLMSGYLGSIGFGYPAAMGAWAAAPERPIVALTGDGGFGQYMGELCTAVKYNMNITHILINNNELGKISTEQRMAEMEVWETGLHNPNFAEYAEICGAKGFRVEKPEEIAEAVKAALAHEGAALVEIMCDPELV
ncbi:Putative thiamine pyrophosphate-containing protein YdaP [Pontiella desulfatans]|uniref:Thiamine pyrophosphate-containing protein YdaP n=1 Tax=Pontiella desulfatans TaxID=2750659 RepID=A0A6C2UF32_PONDE|nr:thiamine pyrophosphate-dependent enzyme [Pontiella desulfatans]VGO17816.1 Putative thiamine pyrophosphate-containing protein YdaP [Pontiella desulfatans]